VRAAPGSCDMVGLSCDMQTGTSLFPLDYAMPPRLADVQTLAHTETTWGKKGTTGSRSGAPPSSRPARRRRGVRGCHTLSRVNTV